jgi:hypothetical protein
MTLAQDGPHPLERMLSIRAHIERLALGNGLLEISRNLNKFWSLPPEPNSGCIASAFLTSPYRYLFSGVYMTIYPKNRPFRRT